MADVSSLRRLKPASPHLPVSWYFDPEIFAREKQLLFDAGANYVGHELMVPNVGDYYTLACTNHSKMLVRNEGGVECSFTHGCDSKRGAPRSSPFRS